MTALYPHSCSVAHTAFALIASFFFLFCHHYLSRMYIQIKISHGHGWLQPRTGFRGKAQQDIAPFYHSEEREALEDSRGEVHWMTLLYLSLLPHSSSLCCVTLSGLTDVLTRSFYSCASVSQMFIHSTIIPILPWLNFKNNFSCSWYWSLFSP